MSRTVVTRTIEAPVEAVFDTIAHVENFSRAVPNIANVDYLTDQQRGVGTRFRETRVMRGREATTELEVTEYVENDRVRMVADEGGSVWDTVFTVQSQGEGQGTQLELAMEAVPHKLAARVLNPLTKSIVRRAIEGDMDAVKVYCESVDQD